MAATADRGRQWVPSPCLNRLSARAQRVATRHSTGSVALLSSDDLEIVPQSHGGASLEARAF